MERQVIVAAAVIESEEKILIAQRRSGLWEFPGGKVKYMENTEDTVKREIVEELGCVVDVGEVMTVSSAVLKGKKHAIIIFYKCRISGGKPKAKEHKKIMWITKDDLKKYEFTQADSELIESMCSS